MMKILMIASEAERWGPSRLPQPLTDAGLEVAVLCPKDNPLCQSSFVSRHYELDGLKSAHSFGKTLERAMTDFQPDLVIPCDEPVVVMLHYFLKNAGFATRYIGRRNFDILQRSIGSLDQLDAMVLKHQTRLLAESLGIPVPETRLVSTAEEAAAVAEEFGFPVFLKKSFSWAGQGSINCGNREETLAVFQTLNTRTPWYKKLIKRILRRNWFPVETAIEVQKQIDGDSVMYSAAAKDGHLLAGLFGSRCTKLGPTGPSTVVEVGEHEKCRWAVEKMISAMGASGFLAFDFMRCRKTGDVFLLECNPRPNQICHLGDRVGADLPAALGAALRDEAYSQVPIIESKMVPLFPQEWLRSENEALSELRHMDIPRNDQKLMEFMMVCGVKRGNSVEKLLDAMNHGGMTYAFG